MLLKFFASSHNIFPLKSLKSISHNARFWRNQYGSSF